MTRWTILLITVLGGPMDGSQSYVLYPSLADCERATRAVSDGLAYDHAMTCEEGDMPSGSIRPRRNPVYGGM